MAIGAYAIGTVPIGAAESTTATPAIDDINTDEIVNNAETGNTITYSNYQNQSGTFTLVFRSNADATAVSSCTAVSLSAGTGTFNAPNIRDNGETPTKGCPLKSTNNQPEALLTETDADPDETATIDIDFTAEVNYEIVEVLSATKVEGSILENVTGSIVDESIMYGPTTNNTSLTQSGIVTTDQTSGTINFWLWKKDAGTWEQIIFNLGGTISGGGSITKGITKGIQKAIKPAIKGVK